MAKKTTLKTNTPEELQKFVEDKREALRVLSFAASGSKNRNVKEAKMLRKDVARALTEITARKAK
ncbi:50S ribosomal protein L29 [Acetobacteraceae bacterium]|nr:50S ribosomal protein L29 [Candidatus Parcubacteria bacterium]